MHVSKILLLVLSFVLLAYCVFLFLQGDPRGEYWLIALLPPIVVLTVYAVRTWGSAENAEPLRPGRVLRHYFASHGWWVLFWLVLILLFSTLLDR